MNNTLGIWLALGPLLMGACSSTSDRGNVVTADAEKAVLDALNDAKLPVTTVDCPEDPPAGKGLSFECLAKDASGRPVKVTVTQTDDSGTLDIRTSTIYAPAIETGIDENVEGASSAQCPDGVALKDGNGKIECTATVGDEAVTLVVTITGGDVTNVEKKIGTGDPGETPDPSCADLWSGGTDPACDLCAANHCCDELTACVSGTPCSKYSLCLADCAPGDTACKTTCDGQTEGKDAVSALLSCMAACPSSC